MKADCPKASIVAASWAADRMGIEHVRRSVFILEQQVPEYEEWDAADPVCWHLLANDAAGQPIGTARLEASGKIGRVAVLEPWRGTGIGSQLLEALLDLARRQHIPRVHLNAQETAIDFYRRHGFETAGPSFIEANIPHRRMDRLA